MAARSDRFCLQPQYSSFSYRPDIDGLRAIAVLAVVIYHAFPSLLSGGFVGVDVFFVISGYLISRIIFKHLLSNDFHFLTFYNRRIKRIFPSLAVVLLACYVIGWFILLPDEFKQLGKHMAASAGFVQNLALLHETGYFDSASELKPLLHIWSLGVEEQYYLVYPLIIWLVYRSGINVLAVVLSLAVLSFGLNIAKVETDPISTFLLPQTRLWELLAGCTLACSAFTRSASGNATWLPRFFLSGRWLGHLGRHPTQLANAVSTLGLCLILGTFFLLQEGTRFPGWRALAPVLGALFIILAGPDAWINRAILANRFMVFVGTISYPLYLWHWPMLSFSRVIEGTLPSVSTRLTILGLSAVFAWLTYRFIESPVRFGSIYWPKTAVPIAAIAMAGYMGYDVFERDGLGFRVQDRSDYVNYFENNPPELRYMMRNHVWERDRVECNFLDAYRWRAGEPDPPPRESIDKSCYTPRTSNVILLWGDSHAAHLSYGLTTTLPKTVSLLQVTTSGCQPSTSEGQHPAKKLCDKSNAFALQVIKEVKPQTVVLAQAYGHNVADIQRIAMFLKTLDVKNVFFLGPVPKWEPYLYKTIARKYWPVPPTRIDTNLDRNIFEKDQLLKGGLSTKHDGFEYVSLIDFLCNPVGCLTYVGGDKTDGLITYDHGHFSPAGSIFLAKELLTPKILAATNQELKN